MTNTATPAPCTRCGDTGWLPSKGYRFYSYNGKVCPCGIYATAAEAGNAIAALRQAEAEAARLVSLAEAKAARAARREARRAATEAT